MTGVFPDVPYYEPITYQWRCFHCGSPQYIPIERGWDNPIYVMRMEEQHRRLEKSLDRMWEEVMLLAEECLRAGVRPDVMRRTDELMAWVKRWRESLGLSEGGPGAGGTT